MLAERVVTELIADTSGHDPKIRTSAQVVDRAATKVVASATRIERSANQAFGRIAQEATTAGTAVERFGNRHVTAMQSQRAGMQQLSFQIGDVSQQFALGVRPMTIFAQQGGQVVQALQLMNAGGNRFLNFLSGPWGVALTGAGLILGALLTRTQEAGDGVEELTRRLEENERKAGRTQQAQEAFGRTLPGVTANIREQTEALREQNRTLDENQALALNRARNAQRTSEQLLAANVRAQAAALAEVARLERTASRNARGQIIESVELRQARAEAARLRTENASIREQVGIAQQTIREAQIPMLQRDVETSLDGAAAATRRYEQALADLNSRLRQNLISEREYRRELTDAARRRDREIEAARQSERTERGLVRPVSGAVLSQFNADRSGVPINGRRVARRHQGVDLRGNIGDPVVAPEGGTAFVRNAPGGLGLYVEIRADSGARDLLGHLSAARIQSGQRVTAGQLVGLVGASGNAQGGVPHLHHQRMENGRWVDPTRRYGSSGAAQAALQAAREAEREAEQRARYEAAFQDELRQLGEALLTARRRSVESAEDIAAFAEQEIEAQRQRENAAYEEQERQGRLTAAQRERLVLANDAVAVERQRAVQIRLQQQLDEQRYRIAVEDLRDAVSIEQARGGLARTIAERRESELRLLDLAHREEMLVIERARSQEGLNAAQRARLDREEAAARERYGLAQKSILQRNLTPMQQFLDRAPSSAAELNEALEGVAANGLSALNDGLAEAIGNFVNLGGVAGRIVSQMIADIARLLIYRNITAPLANMLSGGGGGFGSLFGTGTKALSALPAIGTGLKGFAVGGSFMFGGRPGIDQNLLSLNGQPIARVSKGETGIIVPQGGSPGRAGGRARIGSGGGAAITVNINAQDAVLTHAVRAWVAEGIQIATQAGAGQGAMTAERSMARRGRQRLP